MQVKNVVREGLVVGTNIWIDTEQWVRWLSFTNAFRYEGEGTNFNCNRKSNGKWYASKKIYATNGCRLITLYIGGIQACTLERLQEIAEKFALSWTEFWTWYYGPERKESRKSSGKVGQETGCLTSAASDLEAELYRLQSALDEMTADRDRQLIRIADLQNRMHSEIKSCTLSSRTSLSGWKHTIAR